MIRRIRTFLAAFAVFLAVPFLGSVPQQLGRAVQPYSPQTSAVLQIIDRAVTPVAQAAGMNQYLTDKLAGYVYRSAAFTQPTTLCWALLTAAPSDTATGATIAEASYTGYARGCLNAGTSNYTAPTSTGQVCNNATITFGTSITSGPTTVTHFALLDSATIGAGNVLVYGALTNSKVLNDGDGAPTAPASAFCSTLGD